MRWNQIAKLPENSELGCGWFGISFHHLCRVTELKNHSNHFSLCFNRNFYGMAVFENRLTRWLVIIAAIALLAQIVSLLHH